jgi:hypothetical protein
MEFDVDTHRVKLKEFFQLKQTGTVAEYRKQMINWCITYYCMTHRFGGVMLVTQFVLGLKDELRVAVEAQLPDLVERATLMA